MCNGKSTMTDRVKTITFCSQTNSKHKLLDHSQDYK